MSEHARYIDTLTRNQLTYKTSFANVRQPLVRFRSIESWKIDLFVMSELCNLLKMKQKKSSEFNVLLSYQLSSGSSRFNIPL